MLQKLFIWDQNLFQLKSILIPEWSNDDHGMDSTTTTLDINEENNKIEKEEKGPIDTYLKKITIMVLEKRKN